jgi:Secretion system C-terminal sorting domain
LFSGETFPGVYELSQNYPNPFNPATTIRYQLPQDGFVTLKVYDILGKEILTLVNEEKSSGRYEVNFDASKLASGVYLYRLNVNDYVDVRKMLLLK